jgi:superfamily I DNA and RNA helicase
MRRDVQKMPKSQENYARKRTQHDMINQEGKCSGVQLAEKVMGLRPDDTLLDHRSTELHMSGPKNRSVWTFHTKSLNQRKICRKNNFPKVSLKKSMYK